MATDIFCILIAHNRVNYFLTQIKFKYILHLYI